MGFPDYTRDEVAELFRQHTARTGQAFTPEVIDRAFYYTRGQPWLADAIANEITRETGAEPITAEHVEAAKERLIRARVTHLDDLAARLAEPPVKRVIEPMLAGDEVPARDDDVSYVRDLGLIAPGDPARAANPIYKEIIVQVLTIGIQESITVEPRDYLLPRGLVHTLALLTDYMHFWRKNALALTGDCDYHEVAAHLAFIAYLRRGVGDGSVDCEYGAGLGRVDLLVRKPFIAADGSTGTQRAAIQLITRGGKQGREGRNDPRKDGLARLDRYLDALGLDAGYLVIFDRRPSATRKRPRPSLSFTATPSGREARVITA